jgi:hypothetical protein
MSFQPPNRRFRVVTYANRYKEVELGDGCAGSINSEGLPNKGIDYYISKEVVDKVSGTGKPYFVSLSGLSLTDNLEMLSRSSSVDGIAAVELNLACPNIPGKPTMAYDFEQMDAVLKEVTSHPAFTNRADRPLGVKLAPYFDIPHFQRAAEILNKYVLNHISPPPLPIATSKSNEQLLSTGDTTHTHTHTHTHTLTHSHSDTHTHTHLRARARRCV